MVLSRLEILLLAEAVARIKAGNLAKAKTRLIRLKETTTRQLKVEKSNLMYCTTKLKQI